MTSHLKGKVALVTGSSKGIGFAIAKALLAQGCQVVLNGRDVEALKKTADELGALFFVGDVTEPQACQELISFTQKNLQRLDILVCNVGSGASVKPGEETYEEWLRVLHVNFLSATNTIEAARDLLGASKGNIVCISSICGQETIPGAPVTYSVAKAALNAYVHGISRPLAQQGIRINALALGNIFFPGSVWDKKIKENPQQVQSMLTQEVALGRLGTSEEIGNFVVFLATQASFMTGAMVTLDGGQVRSW